MRFRALGCGEVSEPAQQKSAIATDHYVAWAYIPVHPALRMQLVKSRADLL
jgi:hypothetical protein